MDTPPDVHTTDPPLTVRLELQLRRSNAGGRWSVEVIVPGTSGRLTFPTLGGLFDYLARLDRPPAGLR